MKAVRIAPGIRIWGLVLALSVLPIKQAFAAWAVPFDGGCWRAATSWPVIMDKVLYIGSFDGAAYAFDVQTGKTKWRFQTGKGLTSGPEIITAPAGTLQDMIRAATARKSKGKREIVATPVVQDSMVYVGSRDHQFYAFDAATGQLKWSFSAASDIYNEAIFKDGQVYFSSGNFIYSLDTKNGQQRWLFETLKGMHPAAKSRPPSTPVLSAGVVYATNWPYYQGDAPLKSYLYAIDARSGKEKWVFSVDGNDVSKPAISGGLVFFSLSADVPLLSGNPGLAQLYAVDSRSGTMKWKFDAEESWHHSRAVVGETLVYFSTDKHLYAIDQRSGELAWSFEGEQISKSMHLDKLLHVVVKNKLYGLDPVSGEQTWSRKLGRNLWLRSVVDDVIYISSGTNPFYLIAVDALTGKKRWKFKTGGNAVCSGPVKFDGQLFFSTRVNMTSGYEPVHGRLYSIDAKTGKVK